MDAFAVYAKWQRTTSIAHDLPLRESHLGHGATKQGLLRAYEVSTRHTYIAVAILFILTLHERQTYRNVPIFTLRLPGTRIYAINSVDLIPVVQRQWRTLIFAPIQVKAAQAAMGASKEAVAIMEQDLVTEHGFINGMVKVTHPTMSNGADLDALNAKAFEIFDKSLQEFVSDARSEKRTINMYEWLGKQIMRATTDAVYGSANPMRDAENLRAWQ